MKKILFMLVICLGLCTACKKEEDEHPMLLPTDVVSLDAAQDIVGENYVLTLKNDALVQDGNKITASYLADPIGSGDNVFIDVYETDKNNNSDSIKEKFEASREKRSDFIPVEGMGDDAYITYPTLHLYTHGVYVAITAGSENSDMQAGLLTKFGELAEKNIAKFFNSSYSN